MQLPQSFLSSLHHVPGFDKEAFEQVHQSGKQITSIRINPAKWSIVNKNNNSPFTIDQPVPWSQYGYYLEQRPSFTFDPLFHAGCYYVQEASSMFLEQALLQTVDLTQPIKILDLCAAPGGKSTHLQSLISANSLLVSNEVIRNRCTILIDNITKWGSSNVIATNNDPAAFAQLPGFFDVIVVDAPCSGSGLFRKDADAINEWSLNNVALCSQRQQRILADALPALKEGGMLIYSTCSYSEEEDEAIADWLVQEVGLKNERLKIDESWGIVESSSQETGSCGYRFFPDKVKGEGFYLSCFRKIASSEVKKRKAAKIEKATAKEAALAASWINEKEITAIKLFDKLFAVPNSITNDFAVLKSSLNIQYAGVLLGEEYKGKLVPAHPLALSSFLAGHIPFFEAAYEDAIRYLQRGELKISPPEKGWQAVRYKGHNLGWINALPNRVNNYYPKELRILKQQDDAFRL